MVALPGQLFYSTQIPACLWFIARDKRGQPSPVPPLPKGEGHYRGGFTFSGLVEMARNLRQRATPAEVIAWEIFRNRRFLGLKFRRQHQIGDYIVDFYCEEKKLVVELDGSVHYTDDRHRVDRKRDEYLKSIGMKVLRFSNELFLSETPQALAEIEKAVSPSPSGRGTRVRGTGFRDRRGEILFIDARKMGRMVDRTHRELTDEDIRKIADTYHAWSSSSSPLPLGEGQGEGGVYHDIPGFCKSATIEEIRKQGYVLTPGRYVGAEIKEEDKEPFNEKMRRLVAQWREQQAEAAKLDASIKANLKELGYDR